MLQLIVRSFRARLYRNFFTCGAERYTRLLFALSAQLNLVVTQVGITTAFQIADLEEDMYMQKLDYFPNCKDDGMVLHLKKAVYGLKQSSRAQYIKVDDYFIAVSYKRSKIEPFLYTKNYQCKTLYVDNVK